MSFLIIMLCIFGIALIGLGYIVVMEMFKDMVIIVNKDGSLSPKKLKMKGLKIVIDKATYVIDSDAAHTNKGFMFWRRIYVYDQGVPTPRILKYKKDNWLDGTAITKIINDEHIKMMSSKVIEPTTKMFIILGAVAGLLACIASVLVLLKDLGIIQ